jgi:mRNA-degrading endonuclease RelE of RelBE toxin-antitoxin system
MIYNVIATPAFKKELKRLAKKYNSLKQEFSELVDSLEQEPEQGTSLGNHCYKIRLAIKSKGKGKSGGARVITYVYVADNTVFLLTIYDKSEQAGITDAELKSLLKNTGL